MSKKIGEDKSFIVKSNALIEARYSLSLQESQVVLWLLTQIKPDDKDFKSHKIEIAEFAKFKGVRIDSRYDELRKITKRLMQRVMKIYESQTKTLIQVSWLSSAIYEYNKCTILLKFDPGLKPYLLQSKIQFTKISITDTLKRKVIERAKEEITAKTNYEIDYEEIKESRRVVAIEWRINKKNLEEEKQKK